ncbi:hypothetical protein diail_8407 [Diaporthe ilicicola]|nr:hypothetical protein diail_8407 [Diaporthe ilicicola]
MCSAEDCDLSSFSEIMATDDGLVPIRSITRKSDGEVYTYMNSEKDIGEGYKLLSGLLDEILAGNVADEFGWNVKAVYDTRLDTMSHNKRIDKAIESSAAITRTSIGGQPKDFYFALLPARRYCN